MKSTLLKNCRIVENNKLIPCHLFLEGEKIGHISDDPITADEVIDIKGKIVIPGMIDCHVHCREPGNPQKEDYLTISRAAAKGGITTFLDMPNNTPPTTTVERLEEKRVLAKKSLVDYGFHFGADGKNEQEIKNAKNIASVKLYLDLTTGGLKLDDFSSVERILNIAPFCAVHAEQENLTNVISLASGLKKKVYACHISTAAEIQEIRKNRKSVFAEVAPHHLFLTEDDAASLGMLGHVRPALKTKADQEALWNAIAGGLVDTIATDHAPHLKEEKMEKEIYGFPGLETVIPLLLHAVNEKRLTLQDVVVLTSRNPAKVFGIHNKGQLKEGFDADLAVIDLDLEKEVRGTCLLTKCAWSPFEGKVLKGWPVATFIRGTLVYRDGNFFPHQGKEITIIARRPQPPTREQNLIPENPEGENSPSLQREKEGSLSLQQEEENNG